MRFNIFSFFCFLLFLSCKEIKDKEFNQDKIESVSEGNIDSEQRNSEAKAKPLKFDYKYSIQVKNDIESKLDSLINCNDFVYNDYFFRIPDYGCVYNPSLIDGNTLGLADVILFLKKQDKEIYDNYSDDQVYKTEDSLNSIKSDINLIKKRFNPAIFLIEKKYLEVSNEGELPYYPSLPYVKKLFVYQKENWFLVDSLYVEVEKSDYEWVETNISNLSLH